ncbi:MAG: hypothetical protein ABI690_24410 [Chloroflexota bacterium]
MTVEVSWHEEGRVIYQRFQGALELADVETVEVALRQRSEEGLPPVHVIVDVRQVTEFPVSFDELNRLKIAAGIPGWMVVIGLHPVVRSMARMMSWIRGVQYHPVSTLEDGLNFLARQDSSLNYLTPETQ